MLNECLEALITDPKGIYVDGTLGNGGHSGEILKRLEAGGTLIGFDRDIDAIDRVKEKLFSSEGKTVELVHDNYANMAEQLDRLGVEKVDGLLLDLGVSSFQLDLAERGFSFQQDAPIDMRMDQTQGQTAGELVNTASETELADLIYRYGEDKASRRIARAIVEARGKKEISTTLELAAIVERAKGGRKGKKTHPATKTFQALRIAVNDELGELEALLEQAPQLVRVGGVVAVISFHSLEDRMVKHAFRDSEQLSPLTKRPIVASDAERDDNPRSRSAKLRAARRVEVGA